MKLHSAPHSFLPYIRILRPMQWAKNAAVYAPVLFGGHLLTPSMMGLATSAFIVLSLLSSSHYIINDLVDLPANKLHPTKRSRPLPSGAITVRGAWILWAVFTIAGAAGAVIIGPGFALVALVFSVLHYLLLFYFRYLRILDILALAAGYALRLWAGQAATGIHISIWLALSGFCLSLLFAIGKRRYDLAVSGTSSRKLPRDTGLHYSTTLLDAYMAMFATATFVSYSYFTFLTTFTGEGLGPEGAPVSLLVGRKWLMATIPFVLFAIMRYLQRMYVIEGSESSHQSLMTRDTPLLISVAGWALTVVLVIYVIGR